MIPWATGLTSRMDGSIIPLLGNSGGQRLWEEGHNLFNRNSALDYKFNRFSVRLAGF